MSQEIFNVSIQKFDLSWTKLLKTHFQIKMVENIAFFPTNIQLLESPVEFTEHYFWVKIENSLFQNEHGLVTFTSLKFTDDDILHVIFLDSILRLKTTYRMWAVRWYHYLQSFIKWVWVLKVWTLR